MEVAASRDAPLHSSLDNKSKTQSKIYIYIYKVVYKKTESLAQGHGVFLMDEWVHGHRSPIPNSEYILLHPRPLAFGINKNALLPFIKEDINTL